MSLLTNKTWSHYRIFFCSNGNTSRWRPNKILLVCCAIVSFNNHDNDHNNNNDNCHHHCYPLKHNDTTEFSFALMETLLGEHWLKFYLFVAQWFHLTMTMTTITTTMIIIVIVSIIMTFKWNNCAMNKQNFSQHSPRSVFIRAKENSVVSLCFSG